MGSPWNTYFEDCFFIRYALISLAQSVTIYKKNCKTRQIYVRACLKIAFWQLCAPLCGACR